MTAALCVLGAVIGILILAVWYLHKEQSDIAANYVDLLHDRLKAADAERERLLTRIQTWEPPKPEPPRPAQSQAEVIETLEKPQEYTAADLAVRGLVDNGDGTVVEYETGRRWDSVTDFDKWTAFRQEQQLPDTANPEDYQRRVS